MMKITKRKLYLNSHEFCEEGHQHEKDRWNWVDSMKKATWHEENKWYEVDSVKKVTCHILRVREGQEDGWGGFCEGNIWWIWLLLVVCKIPESISVYCLDCLILRNGMLQRQKFNYCWRLGFQIQLLFPIRSWLMPERASRHPKLAPIPMDRQLPDGDWPTSGQVNSCKVSPKVGCLTLA